MFPHERVLALLPLAEQHIPAMLDDISETLCAKLDRRGVPLPHEIESWLIERIKSRPNGIRLLEERAAVLKSRSRVASTLTEMVEAELKSAIPDGKTQTEILAEQAEQEPLAPRPIYDKESP